MHTLDNYPSLKRGLGLMLLVAGMALSAFLLFALSKDLSLWIFGRPVSAQVVDSWAKAMNSGEQEELAFRYYVRYRFATPEGKIVVSTKTVSAQEWAGVGHGSQGQGGVDFYTGEAEGPSAPVYQEQEHLSEFAEGGMATAAEVDVIYFPLYPAHNRLAEGRFVPLLACTYVPLLVMAGLALLGARQFLRTDPTEDRWEIREVAPVRVEN